MNIIRQKQIAAEYYNQFQSVHGNVDKSEYFVNNNDNSQNNPKRANSQIAGESQPQCS